MQTKKSLGPARLDLKRSLGQNFLRDKRILKKIADFADIKKEDVVVEVGPGEGTLTELLLERAGKVVAIEKDERMVDLLQHKFEREIENNKLQIIEGDVLKLRAESLELREKEKGSKASNPKLQAINYKLVGNIPYYITGALFKKALEAENQPKSITFVVQKEVAERIMARDRKESILSISIKVYGTPEYGGIIKAGSFHPKPKVDSAILAIRNISKIRFLRSDLKLQGPKGQTLGMEKKFFEILKSGFAHKRKLLIKNLADMSRLNLDTGQLRKSFEKCGISEKARAEDLKVEDWLAITKELF